MANVNLLANLDTIPESKSKQKKVYRKTARAANDYYLNGNYCSALPLFLKLDSLRKGNANVNFKIGYCYLYCGIAKMNSVPYFENASKNVSASYNESSIYESKAPLATYAYLGVAYQLNYNFDSAIVLFEKYKELLLSLSINNRELDDINRNIESCKFAMELIDKPTGYTVKNLGENVNSKFADYSPVVSLDEKTLIFTSKRPGSFGGGLERNGSYYDDIYVSIFENFEWGKAKSIGSNINTDKNEATVNLSADGQNLLIYKDGKGHGDIYQSKKEGLGWGVPQDIGANINGPGWETHACYTSDNNALYFVSDRPGGFGGRDIYKCLRLPNGEWGIPQNLGQTVNTVYDEEGIFIHPNGKEIYFSSKGHATMGGFDIFKSKINDENGFWSVPVNMGYPINSPDDDVYFVVSADGKRGYFSSNKREGFGEKDIYMIDFREVGPEALTLLKGFVTLNGESPSGGLENVNIVATDIQTDKVVQFVKPLNSTGQYIMLLSSGINGKTYSIRCTANGYKPIEFVMTVPPDSSYQEIDRSLKLQFINFESKTIDSVKLISSKTRAEIFKNAVVSKSLNKGEDGEEDGVVEEKEGEDLNSPKIIQEDPVNVPKQVVKSEEVSASEKYKVGEKINLGYFLYDPENTIYQKAFKEEMFTLIMLMRKYPEMKIEIGGHTDSTGNEEYNYRLSRLRAQTIADLLVKSGIAEERLKVKGYGSSLPFAPNTLPSGKPDQIGMKLNRRVELKVIELKDK